MLVAAEDAVAHVPAAAAHAQPQDAGPTVVDVEDVEAVVDVVDEHWTRTKKTLITTKSVQAYRMGICVYLRTTKLFPLL